MNEQKTVDIFNLFIFWYIDSLTSSLLTFINATHEKVNLFHLSLSLSLLLFLFFSISCNYVTTHGVSLVFSEGPYGLLVYVILSKGLF